MTRPLPKLAVLLSLTVALGSCGDEDSSDAAVGEQEKSVVISAQKVMTTDLPVWLETVGQVHALSAPDVAAEVDGRITMIAADTGDEISRGQRLAQIDTTALLLQQTAAQARIDRLAVHIANGERRVGRLEQLMARELSSQAQLDDAREQLEAFRADHKAALAELGIVNDSLAKSSIVAPVSGVVQRRLLSEGDFVTRGQALFSITRPRQLQAWLPYAESLALQVRVGQAARIYSPLTPGVMFEGSVTDIQPALGAGSRAVTAIVDIDEPGDLRPEATLAGEVLVETRKAAVMVPTISLVRRPDGNVVYVVEGNVARARAVVPGNYLDGHVEIARGLDGSETVAVDGAAFLTDGARVTVREPAP